MRIVRSTLIGTAVAVAIFGQSAFADDPQIPTANTAGGVNNAANANDNNLEEVVVTGIAYSLKESLATKRASTNQVEVVTGIENLPIRHT